MPRLTNRVVLLSDLVFVGLSPLFTFILRFDGFEWAPRYTQTVIVFSIVALAAKLITFRLAGLYRRVWQSASVGEMVLIVKAVLAVTIVTFVAGCFLLPALGLLAPRVPYSVPIIDGLLTMAASGGARFSVRVLEGEAA